MKKILLALMSIALMAGSVSAQQKHEKSYQRIQVGYGRIGIEVEDMMNGPSLIWTKGISLHHKTPVYLQFGANAFYGSGTGNYADTKFISVNIPVAVAYQFTKTFSLYGGLNTRGNILGKRGTEDGWDGLGDKNDSDDWFSGEDAAKRFNFGYILGVNFTHNRFTWGLEYVRDFTEFMPLYRLSYIGISAGIKF